MDLSALHAAGRPVPAMASIAAGNLGGIGVVVMADVSTRKRKCQTRVLRALSQPPDLSRHHRDPAGNPARQARERFARCGRQPDRRGRARLSGQLGARRTAGASTTSTRTCIARAPNLLIVSTGGAGYDTVNVKDCTDAGVLVVNQTGGNADAVASHVLGDDADAVEAGRAGQPRAPQGHDEGPQPLHGQRHPQQDDRHRRARQRRPPHRQALRARCST